VAEWQLRAADFLVLSKVDLASPENIVQAEAQLRALNPRAPIILAARGAVDPELLFGPRLAADDPAAEPSHLRLDGFGSFVWEGNTPLRRAALVEAMRGLPPQIYRAKGVVHCGDAPWPDELHYVGGRLELTAFRPREPARPLNRLALIGAGAEGARAEISALLDGCAEEPGRATAWGARYRELF
jgi:cobalamin biosynthesis protein CobW